MYEQERITWGAVRNLSPPYARLAFVKTTLSERNSSLYAGPKKAFIPCSCMPVHQEFVEVGNDVSDKVQAVIDLLQGEKRGHVKPTTERLTKLLNSRHTVIQ